MPIKSTATVIAALALALAATAALGVEAQWQEGYSARTRMIAGNVDQDGAARPYAFVEIELAKGWKTYWRNPGDAGGVPPNFNWSRSANLGSARVLYPAPHRLSDEAGDNIGYKDAVTFPVAVEPKDPSKPVVLALDLQFGICKDICVPSEAAIDLEIPAGTAAGAAAPESVKVLDRVPREGAKRRANDPVLKRAAIDATGAKPKIVLEASFPGGAKGADIFLEAPDGLYIPMPRMMPAAAGDDRAFETELGPLLEIKDLEGKTLEATLVSDQGQSIVSFTLD